MNKNKGFNIIEVAMSIMIVSIAIIMMVGIYTNIIKAQAKGIGKTVASSVAERIMQNIIANQISTIKATIKAHTAKNTTIDTPNNYKYELIGKDIINSNTYYYYTKIYPIGGKYFNETNILQVDVVVYYDLKEDITEEEIKNITDEKNSVRFSRLITFSDDD